MIVFIAHRVYVYEDEPNWAGHILGVFSTKERAQKAIDASQQHSDYACHVSTWTVDENDAGSDGYDRGTRTRT